MLRKWIENCNNRFHRREWTEKKRKKKLWRENRQQSAHEMKQFNEMKNMLNWMNEWMEEQKKALRMKNNINNRNCLIEKFCASNIKMCRNQCNDFWALLINSSCHAVQIYRHKLPISSGFIIFIAFEWAFWDFAFRMAAMAWCFSFVISFSSLNIYNTDAHVIQKSFTSASALCSFIILNKN